MECGHETEFMHGNRKVSSQVLDLKMSEVGYTRNPHLKSTGPDDLKDGYLSKQPSHLMPKMEGPDDAPGSFTPDGPRHAARQLPTEGGGLAADSLVFLLSPNAINSIKSMLKPRAR